MRSSWSSVEKVNWVSTLTTPTQTYSKIPWEYWLRTIAPAEHKERKRDSIITAIKLIEYSALVFELQITRNIFWQSFLMDDDAPNGCTRPKCQRISNKTQTNAHIYQQGEKQEWKNQQISFCLAEPRRKTDKGTNERKSRCIYKFDADGFQRQNRPDPSKRIKQKEKEKKMHIAR